MSKIAAALFSEVYHLTYSPVLLSDESAIFQMYTNRPFKQVSWHGIFAQVFHIVINNPVAVFTQSSVSATVCIHGTAFCLGAPQ